MNKILIVGTGAMATLFAARLAAAGSQVTMLGTWQEAIQVINRDGVGLRELDGREVHFCVQATQKPSDCIATDLALVLVKSWQTRRAAGQLAECLPPKALALTLQNGLGNQEALAEILGLRRVILGVTTYGATLLGPGMVGMGGAGEVSLEKSPQSQEIGYLLQNAGLKVEYAADASSLVWGKLVISAAINPLTALLRVQNGALLDRPQARAVMDGLAIETAAVAYAAGVQLPFQDPVLAVEQVARKTAANWSSMFQDVQRGAKTEIDSICGQIVQMGEKYKVKTPLNWTMWQIVNAMLSN